MNRGFDQQLSFSCTMAVIVIVFGRVDHRAVAEITVGTVLVVVAAAAVVAIAASAAAASPAAAASNVEARIRNLPDLLAGADAPRRDATSGAAGPKRNHKFGARLQAPVLRGPASERVRSISVEKKLVAVCVAMPVSSAPSGPRRTRATRLCSACICSIRRAEAYWMKPGSGVASVGAVVAAGASPPAPEVRLA